jgi:hypothetical protein
MGITYQRTQYAYCCHIVCSLGKNQPKQQVCGTTENTYHYQLNRCPPHFSEVKIEHKGGFLDDPRGIEMGGGRSLKSTPIGQDQG